MYSVNEANRLIDEKSPYLLQHAQNPVEWYAWGEEAFQKAARENKPIFLSIGYSTCHWCHVMAHESFEDEEVAKLLNLYFVCVKVDREERPDIDAVYMAVCQAMTGSGGWPLTMIMTPDRKPFFAATYLPKHSRYGVAGMMQLLPEIAKQWETDRDRLAEAGEESCRYLSGLNREQKEGEEPTRKGLNEALTMYESSFDPVYGGFGRAPKFPAAHNLLFLMRYAQLERYSGAMSMAEKTLEQMAKGGIYDHIGGGFSRYSTDNRYLVPHFEKMLYDNALLLLAYTEAYRITGHSWYQGVAEGIIHYVLREMTHSQGGFYSAQDADSEGVEGGYYVFTPEEIIQMLGSTDGERFCEWFDITKKGNFEGKNIPNRIGKDLRNDPDINALCKKVYDYRLARTKLQPDDKILTSWNALMIMALAKAGRVLGKQEYIKKAQEAETFLAGNLTEPYGKLKIRWREGQAAYTGQLGDYAFYALALLELYRSTFLADYLKQAIVYADTMLGDFYDDQAGGFFLYSAENEQLIARLKEVYDGAMPSGNSAAAMVLAELYALTGEAKWRDASDRQFKFLAANIKEYPVGYSFSLLAMTKVLYPSAELVCVSSDIEVPKELSELMNGFDKANLTVLYKNKQSEPLLSAFAPFSTGYKIPPAGTVYYLCMNGACEEPTHDIKKVKERLAEFYTD